MASVDHGLDCGETFHLGGRVSESTQDECRSDGWTTSPSVKSRLLLECEFVTAGSSGVGRSELLRVQAVSIRRFGCEVECRASAVWVGK